MLRIAAMDVILIGSVVCSVGACSSIHNAEDAVATAAKACPEFHIDADEWQALREQDGWKVSPKNGRTIWVNVHIARPTTDEDCRILIPD